MHQYVLSVDNSLIYLYFRTTDVPGEKFSCHFTCKVSTGLLGAPGIDMLGMALCTPIVSLYFACLKQHCPIHSMNM